MSIPDPWPDAGPTLSEDAAESDVRLGRTNQPWRAAVAAGEVLVAVGLVLAAWWSWGRGMVSFPLPSSYGVSDVVTRWIGSWLALAVVFGTGAGLAAVDSARQLVLALGTGRRRKSRSAAEA